MLKFRWETEFKETEIGEIPKDWEVKRLGDIANISTGGTPSRKVKKYWGGEINWLKSQEVNDNYIYDTEEKITEEGRRNSNAKRIYPPGTLILAIYAAPTAGRVGILKTYSTINQALAALESECNEFLFYSFIGNRERLLLFASGAAQQNLNLDLIRDFAIPFPPLPEQSRIATVLSWFDELIENKKRQNEILEKTAMAIFKSWFIDFEHFKDEEFVYNEDLGKEIPKGWEVRRLGEVAEIIRGVSFQQDESSFEYFPKSVPMIRANNIMDNKSIDFRDLMFIPSHKVPEFKKLREKDIIMVGSNGNPSLVGKFAVFVENPDFPEISFGSFMYCIRTRFDYIFSNLNSDYFKEFLSSVVSGTNISNLKKSDLENYKLLFPPLPILQRYHSLVEPLFQKIILNQKQIMILRKIRDTLLPLLVFGKLRVEEI
ncbi:MAG: restriction endonuclease subunit S [Dictyoglomus sp. NZ13-RE01]|nr:MAG: restriction endonuclease subunit S [Dictyoglomus sp. NZ13-RE01]